MAAAIFWLKARAGWKEGQVIEVEHAKPNVENLSRADREKLRTIMMKTGVNDQARLVGAATHVQEES